MTATMRGFVLLYVLAVMAILSGLALTLAYRERIGAKLVHNVVDGAREETALRSALALTEAQLELSSLLAPPPRDAEAADKPAEDKGPGPGVEDSGPALWRAGDVRKITVGDVHMSVTLTDEPIEPDFNQFDAQELGRLFIALGASTEYAAAFAVAVIDAKPASGFRDRESLLAIPGVPQEYLGDLDARSDGKPRDPAAGEGKTLYDLVTLGSQYKRIDLDRTPLAIVAALTGIDAERLAVLQKLRASGQVDRRTAIARVGKELEPLVPNERNLKARFAIEGSATWGEAWIVQREKSWNNAGLILHRGRPEADRAAGAGDEKSQGNKS